MKETVRQTKRKTNILVECPELIASVKVGVLDVLAPLENDIVQTRFRRTREVAASDLQWADMLIIVRGCEQMTLEIAKEAKRLGRFIVYFLDDDLLHLPEDTQAFRYFHDGNHQFYLKEILKCSDALWGVNTLIRDDYLSYCGKDRWICSKVPVIEAPFWQEDDDLGEIRVLYAGSVDHTSLVRQLIVPALERVLEQCQSVSFTFIGADPGIRGNDRIRYIPYFQDYTAYREYVENGHFHIGLAPVRTSHFYQCKYYNKFVEYTSIGAAGVYTDCPLYRQVVINKENGVLCENTPEKWADAIIELAAKEKLRQSCYGQASMLLREQFNTNAVAGQTAEQLPELRDFRAPIIGRRQVHLPNAKLTFYKGRVQFLFQSYGLLAVPVIAWKVLKKIVNWLKGRCGRTV